MQYKSDAVRMDNKPDLKISSAEKWSDKVLEKELSFSVMHKMYYGF